jgi:type II secretion system protein N
VRIRRIILQIVAYILYALVAFGVFVYVLFPYDILQQRLIEWVSQEGVQLVLTRLRPAFPPGLRAEDIRLQVDQLSPSDATLRIDTLRIQPDWLALLARKMQLHFEAKLYKGRLEGDVHYTKVEGTPLWDIKTRFADLDVAQHALLRKDDKAFIRGRLSGDSAVTLAGDGQVQEGNANMRVQSMAFMGAQGWQWQLQREIACDTLQGELKTTAKQGGTVLLTCQGKDLAIEGRGTVGWKTPLTDSQLNMRGQIRSEEAYKQEVDLLAALVRKRPGSHGELSFRLQGPLRQLRLGA